MNHALGYVLYFSGRPSDAIPAIERALQLDPAFGQAYSTLALARAAAGQTEQAAGILEKLLERNPLDQEAILQLSNLHIQAARFEEASRVLEPYLRGRIR